ncbi:nitrite reductase/ring-hydroxylating ferredoxin subunit [Neorhizobium sp. 2083]|uniref:Rieske (2Fe-2S) protein n=1 Tax=Neorhizobium sp. 2083 TaxID=2817762 RepID=UPI00285B089E|nr:Rieske 2Fe-2S domain-containing protein [Neorhizobium sp. 2083]MDR6817788.1 nitrite reductase/ring-hydroxylating ferredoxin subunit [Neorhizobium sp. 2083]
MAEYLVCSEDEIADGDRKVVACGEREIGIFRVKGALHAWHNMCPHRQGPICQGRIYPEVIEPVDEKGEVRTLQYNEENMHVACPWHGWEFNLETGRNAGPAKYRLHRAELAIREGQIYVVL